MRGVKEVRCALDPVSKVGKELKLVVHALAAPRVRCLAGDFFAAGFEILHSPYRPIINEVVLTLDHVSLDVHRAPI